MLVDCSAHDSPTKRMQLCLEELDEYWEHVKTKQKPVTGQSHKS